MKVIKFGGSSLASSTQIDKVIQIVQSDANRKFVVVSAPGKRTAEDKKVTDLLIELYQALLVDRSTKEIIKKIYQRYEEIAQAYPNQDTVLHEILQDLTKLNDLKIEDNPYYLDAILATGENCNAKLIASILSAQGTPAKYVNPKDLGIVVTSEPQNAQVIRQSYNKIYQWMN